MTRNKVLFAFTIAPETLDKFRHYAKAEHRKMSNILEEQVVNLLQSQIEARVLAMQTVQVEAKDESKD